MKEKSPYRQQFGGDKSPSNNIIVDRKKKNFYYGHDKQWVDPMGVEKARKAKTREIPIDRTSANPIHRFLSSHQPKDILRKRGWFVKSDMSRTFNGVIVDVLPPSHLLVKCSGKNLPMTFESCISLEAV